MIYYDKSKKRWIAEVHKTHPDGRFLERKKSCKTQEEAKGAEQALDRLLTDMLYYPERIQKPTPKFKDFLPEFLAHYKGVTQKPGTYLAREKHLKSHVLPVVGNKHLADIKESDGQALNEFMGKKGLTNHGTLNGPRSALSLVLKYAKEKGILKEIPEIKYLPVETLEIDTITDEEELRLLQAASELRWRVAFLLAGGTSVLRRNEVIGADWSDIDWQTGLFHVRRQFWRGEMILPKNGKTREVPLSEATLTALKAFSPQETGRIFPGLTESTASYNIVRLSRNAGIRQIGWHVLRHTGITRLANSGAPLHVVMKIAGHASLEVTKRYLHAYKDDLIEAAAKVNARVSSQKESTPQEMPISQSLSESWLSELLDAKAGSEARRRFTRIPTLGVVKAERSRKAR